VRTPILSAPKRMPKKFEELVRMFPPHAIHDAVDYENTQEVIDRLTSIPKLTKGQAEYLDTLTVLFEAYEEERYRVETSDISGREALRYLLDRNDMTPSDLGRLLGDRSLGSRILRGERQLSKSHIRKLCERFHVSADLFLG